MLFSGTVPQRHTYTRILECAHDLVCPPRRRDKSEGEHGGEEWVKAAGGGGKE